jgi:hypothetical protein
MSPGAAGRLLAGERRTYRLHELCHTRSTTLGGRIPIHTFMDPPLLIPGVPPWTWWVEAEGKPWETLAGRLPSPTVPPDAPRQGPYA